MKPVSQKALRVFQNWGKTGGKKRAKNLSASKRRAISRHAAQARWGRKKENETSMPSVRLEEFLWESPVYLEEVLSYGGLRDWKELRRRVADRPFGPEAASLEKVLNATKIYGAAPLWKAILGQLQGRHS